MATKNTHFGAEKIEKIISKSKKVFFIGIGGVSMSSLAFLTAKRGLEVAGSDRVESEATQKLAKAGIKVFIGHDAENVKDADAVVYTVAIAEDNPEFLAAKEAGIPRISRADYLGYIMTASKNRIGISGMHGKSTCTSMCASVFMDAGLDPTVVAGADYPKMGGYYRLGEGDDFIFEACEYMDSFLDFNPTTAVILNIELEHVDYFDSIKAIRKSFGKFAGLTGEKGTVIYNADDEDVVAAIDGFPGKLVSFGVSDGVDYSAKHIKAKGGLPEFDIYKKSRKLCHVALKIPGTHNIMNALAAAAAAAESKIPGDVIAKGLEDFAGAKRRMEYKGEINGAKIYDDYGHHPTEIASTLIGARMLLGEEGRLFCVFQPHTYSRTAALLDEFAAALRYCDRLLLVPIYAARETDDLGVSSELIADLVGGGAKALGGVDKVMPRLKKELKPGDLCVVMGAGDIENVFAKQTRKKK